MPNSVSADELAGMNDRFISAAEAILRGDAGPMLALWSATPDATYCDPGGDIHDGWEAVRAYWQQAAEANAEGGVTATIAAHDLSLVAGADLAYTVGFEHIELTSPDGRISVLQARATNVFRREADGWRMIHRHAEPAERLG